MPSDDVNAARARLRRLEDRAARQLASDMKRWHMCHCGHSSRGHYPGEGCTYVIPVGAIGTPTGEHHCPCTEGCYPREDEDVA